jgi:hypothetical protein
MATNKVSIDSDNKCQTNDSEWDTAIRDAEIEIQELTRKTTRLKQAIRIFRENKKDGMKWPAQKRVWAAQELGVMDDFMCKAAPARLRGEAAEH